jgi:hypothetical protein
VVVNFRVDHTPLVRTGETREMQEPGTPAKCSFCFFTHSLTECETFCEAVCVLPCLSHLQPYLCDKPTTVKCTLCVRLPCTFSFPCFFVVRQRNRAAGGEHGNYCGNWAARVEPLPYRCGG